MAAPFHDDVGFHALAGGDERDLPILLKSVSFPQLLLHLGFLMCEIILPPRAEVDMPPPEPPDQRLRIPIIMCPQLAVLARVCFCLSHGFDVLIGLKIRKYSFAMTNRTKTVKRLYDIISAGTNKAAPGMGCGFVFFSAVSSLC